VLMVLALTAIAVPVFKGLRAALRRWRS